MQIKPGTETSFALVSLSGRVVRSYEGGDEAMARQRAKELGLRLFRSSTTVEEVAP